MPTRFLDLDPRLDTCLKRVVENVNLVQGFGKGFDAVGEGPGDCGLKVLSV